MVNDSSVPGVFRGQYIDLPQTESRDGIQGWILVRTESSIYCPRNSSKFFVRIDPEDDTMFAEYHPSVARRQLLKIDPRP